MTRGAGVGLAVGILSHSAAVMPSGGMRLHLLLRARVLIENDVFSGVETALLAAIYWVRLPLFGAVVVPIAVVSVRHREVRLLDPAQHLPVQLLLQRFGVLHAGGRVGVLRLEI